MIEKTKKYVFAGISKKVYTYFIDVLTVFVLALILNLSCLPILENLSSYKNATTLVNEKVTEIYKIEEEANLIDLVSLDGSKQDNPINRDDMFTKYVNRHIALSYLKDSGNEFRNNNVTIDNFKYGELTPENDYLSYLYLEFIPSHDNSGFESYGKEPMEYYINDILNKYLKDQNAFIVRDGIPYLNSSYGYNLYRYVIKEEKNHEAGKANYDTLYSFFNKVLDNSLTIFSSYEPFKNIYSIYLSQYEFLIDSSILYQFIIYVISFALMLAIIPLFTKNRTIGCYLSKTTLFDINEKKIKWYMLSAKKLCDFISMYWLNLVISFFTIGMVGVAKSVFSIGSLNVSIFMFIFISMILATISVVVGISREDKRCLSELVSNTIYLTEEKEFVVNKKQDLIEIEENKVEKDA